MKVEFGKGVSLASRLKCLPLLQDAHRPKIELKAQAVWFVGGRVEQRGQVPAVFLAYQKIELRIFWIVAPRTLGPPFKLAYDRKEP